MASPGHQQQLHFLLLPYSEQGHSNPMLGLGSQLAALGCRVTFVKAEREATKAREGSKNIAATSLKDDRESAQEGLHFVTLPALPGSSDIAMDRKSSSRYLVFKKTLAGLEERQVMISKIVEDSKASAHPISCIICDSCIWRWVKHVVHQHGLRSAVFSIFSAVCFYKYYMGQLGKETEAGELLASLFGMPARWDDPANFGLSSMKDASEVKLQKQIFFYKLFESMEEADAILLSSFKDLEAPLLPALYATGLDVRFIGPCLPAWREDEVGLGSLMARRAGGNFEEEEGCLQWLDQQERGSVLYVSFGSEAVVEAEQIQELAMGIEESGHKFLWVVRPDAPASRQPTEAFRQRSKGMFVGWAPQRRVLQHAAVGGFLTHSGWNSTMESLTYGVPMVCMPVFGDQPLNANFVQGHLQVGLRLPTGPDGLVRSADVGSAVRAVMQGRFSHQASHLRQAAQSAIDEAHHTLASALKKGNIASKEVKHQGLQMHAETSCGKVNKANPDKDTEKKDSGWTEKATKGKQVKRKKAASKDNIGSKASLKKEARKKASFTLLQDYDDMEEDEDFSK